MPSIDRHILVIQACVVNHVYRQTTPCSVPVYSCLKASAAYLGGAGLRTALLSKRFNSYLQNAVAVKYTLRNCK